MKDDAPVCPRTLYLALRSGAPDARLKDTARRYLRTALAASRPAPLPRDVLSLRRWLLAGNHRVGLQFQRYLAMRRAGRPRYCFARRAHALSFLRRSAPTKLVDGAWLYGVLPHWRDPRFHGLIRIYLEELGEGQAGRNHVWLYQHLLTGLQCEAGSELPARYYQQGAVQLCLAWLADEFLPELIGFNLGYEQLPLHLLLTTYELRELRIDARYFSLHVSIDNADTGHAFLACEAVRELLGYRPADADHQRLCQGYALNDAGVGAPALLRECNPAQELAVALRRKRAVGQGVHGDHCRIAGEPVSHWLASAERLPAMLAALRQDGWLRPGEPLSASRFGRLLDAQRGPMAGVFTPYEQQLLADALGAPEPPPRRPAAPPAEQPGTAPSMGNLTTDELLPWLSPAQHFTPAGLAATRRFQASWGG